MGWLTEGLTAAANIQHDDLQTKRGKKPIALYSGSNSHIDGLVDVQVPGGHKQEQLERWNTETEPSGFHTSKVHQIDH